MTLSLEPIFVILVKSLWSVISQLPCISTLIFACSVYSQKTVLLQALVPVYPQICLSTCYMVESLSIFFLFIPFKNKSNTFGH